MIACLNKNVTHPLSVCDSSLLKSEYITLMIFFRNEDKQQVTFGECVTLFGLTGRGMRFGSCVHAPRRISEGKCCLQNAWKDNLLQDSWKAVRFYLLASTESCIYSYFVEKPNQTVWPQHRMRPLALQFLVFRDGGSLRIVNQVCPSQRWVFLSSEGGEKGGQG